MHAVDTGAGSIEVCEDGQTRRVRADVIVGADGIGSVVRRSGAFGARPVKGAHHVIRTVVDGAFNVSGSEYWTALGLFGASPVGQGKTYAYGSANNPEALEAVRSDDLPRLIRLWADALPVAAPLLAQISSIDDVLLNEVGRVRCRSYVDQRAVLIGDAAHAMAPNLGQGANSALVDAAVLARQLADAPTARDAVERYDRQRRRPSLQCSEPQTFSPTCRISGTPGCAGFGIASSESPVAQDWSAVRSERRSRSIPPS